MEQEIYEIHDLINKLNYYTKLYDEGNPAISDKEWDDMYFKLVKLENKNRIYYEDSPTQKVNYQVVNELKKVEHNHPMLSLDKTKDLNIIQLFIGNKPVIAMAKMDGLTCSLRYLNGKLVSAETRGNGLIGEDILHNALQVENIPKKIDFNEELIVDGEIICTYNDFKNFENEYKNPRNFASGSIRLLDSEECASRKLTFVAWDCISNIDDQLWGKLNKLESLGFTVVPNIAWKLSSTSQEDLVKYISCIEDKCKELSYPIDGIVFKYNDCADYDAAGRTDHHFKGGMAYKFYDEEYETQLQNIEWTMGRTGILTPVAIFDPVDIDGTEVSRASLHNIDVASDTLHTGCCYGWKGQKLHIYKANQIIPQISWAESDDSNDKQYFEAPKNCPICGGKTEACGKAGIGSAAVLICTNPECSGKLVNKIEHFCDMKKGLAIKGLSKATIEKLIDWGWVNNISDLFTLDQYRSEWCNKSGFGDASVDKILNAIEESKNCSLENFISAIGIPLIGLANAKEIVKHVSSYEDFRQLCEDRFDFCHWATFGEEKCLTLWGFDFTDADIISQYLNITKVKTLAEDLKLKDLVFCVTGKLGQIWKNREEISADITSLGGKVTDSVSKNTTCLINNDIESTSSKNKKAKELNIPILTEQDFLDKYIS